MIARPLRWCTVALACLLAVGCRDRHEPVKPTVIQLATVPTLPAA